MCGICGFVHHNETTLNTPQLQRMTDTLRHRGPDDSGLRLMRRDGDPAQSFDDGDVGLGQRRLAIIDLSPAGHQPMSADDGRLWTVFNGEIYNFREIRAELEPKGYRFRSASDTEVILAAYREWGADCFRRFIGMFTIALWDGELLLARDRLGIKPLYYAYQNGCFIFASELKAILTHPQFSARLSLPALQQYLYFLYVPAPLSIFEDVFKLLPGHWLRLKRNGEIEQQAFWQIPETLRRFSKTNPEISIPNLRKVNDKIDEADALTRLDELILSAVRYRLISDVPLGAFLSGGIDSGAVVAAMRQIQPGGQLKTFTIGFREADFDEADYARQVAERLATDHHCLYVTPQDFFDLIPKLPDHYDEPFADVSALPTALVSQLARQEVTVSLSGDGGDELFWGYTRYRWLQKYRWWDRLMPSPLRPLFTAERNRWAHGRTRKLLSSLSSRSLAEVYGFLIGSGLQFDQIAALTGQAFDPSTTPFFQHWSRRPQADFVDLHTYLPDDILAKVDRASMMFGLEARVPLLDHRLVEFAMQLPPELKYQNGQQKYLLKKWLFRHLPAELFQRRKQGFGVPIHRWLQKDLKYLLDDYLNPARIRSGGLLNTDAVQFYVAEHLRGDYNHQYILWALVMFEMWQERYLSI